MKMTIRSFSVVRTAKMMAFVYFLMSVITSPLFLVRPGAHPLFKLPIVLIPFAVVGFGLALFVLAAIECLLYNWLAKHVGGIEFTVEEKP